MSKIYRAECNYILKDIDGNFYGIYFNDYGYGIHRIDDKEYSFSSDVLKKALVERTRHEISEYERNYMANVEKKDEGK